MSTHTISISEFSGFQSSLKKDPIMKNSDTLLSRFLLIEYNMFFLFLSINPDPINLINIQTFCVRKPKVATAHPTAAEMGV